MKKIVTIIQIIPYYLLFIIGLIYSLIALPFKLICFVFTNEEKSNSNQNNDNSFYMNEHCRYDFTKAIISIEFYKIKNSIYPSNINGKDFENFLEKWDFLYDEDDCFLEFIKDDLIYLPQERGYELNFNQENNKIELELPPTFWKGLGIIKTNVKGFTSISEN